MKNNPFTYSLDNKRYHTLHYSNIQRYGRKIFKAVLECGFSCPNIDGKKGRGGCIFCDGGSGYFTSPGMSVTEQLSSEYRRIASKHGDNASVIASSFFNKSNTCINSSLLYDSFSSFELPVAFIFNTGFESI